MGIIIHNFCLTGLLFCVPVRCHDSKQTLSESLRVFDEIADLTVALHCCGPEHSEEHQDGTDYPRFYASVNTFSDS